MAMNTPSKNNEASQFDLGGHSPPVIPKVNGRPLPTSRWKLPPRELTLPLGEVHVWKAALIASSKQLEEFSKLLSEDEQQRVQRFYYQQHQQRFIVGRGILRTLLGHYLNFDPQQLRFDYEPRGKPMLASPMQAQLQFNVSHSQDLALYAFAADKVGVDLEYLRSMQYVEQLAKRFFSPQEAAAIAQLPDEDKQAAFFRAWTRKEAYLKATGEGLGGLEQVEVSLLADEPAKLVAIAGDTKAASRWSLYHLAPAEDYLGALAVLGSGWQLTYWQWS